ncbi:hypothetical protein PC9H_004199 [Pleurotus ostreatus]|uniref:Uncharacterized protein n=1 Tax=Pleurotus ostreatus TaxID=5322 RepID=A0A8H7DW43_PLEOS|nr:uncharacterized protein PC9H_004199 [Pleurotus ostreatus]KAF7437360.1 hypothetical protein PC9H_004199 [Pleurotus ostreatus]
MTGEQQHASSTTTPASEGHIANLTALNVPVSSSVKRQSWRRNSEGALLLPPPHPAATLWQRNQHTMKGKHKSG